jgi:hypothetical protein
MLRQELSSAPHSDGMHYFKALEWFQVGEYRITFKPKIYDGKRQRPEFEHAQPLVYIVKVTDPGIYRHHAQPICPYLWLPHRKDQQINSSEFE